MVFCINLHISRIGRHFQFGCNLWSSINYYQSEKILKPYKTFVDILLVYCKKLFNVDLKKKMFSQSDCYLKTKNQKWKHTRHYWVHVDEGFSPCCPLLTKKRDCNLNKYILFHIKCNISSFCKRHTLWWIYYTHVLFFPYGYFFAIYPFTTANYYA